MSMTRKKKRSNPRFKGKLPDYMQGCFEILKSVQAKSDAHPFLEPVDWKRFDLPDYPIIIKRPMDLGTIEKRIFDGFYSTANEFALDVRLVWSNAQKYNLPMSDIYKMSESLSRFFERRFAKLAKSTIKNKRKRQAELREVSRKDRELFATYLEALTGEHLFHVVETVKEQCPGALIEQSDAVNIEVDKIDTSTLLDLVNYMHTNHLKARPPPPSSQKPRLTENKQSTAHLAPPQNKRQRT
ncbi:hypothetical protein AAMO2058_000279600 [Amorphochlora amoebiformis]|uniref:Bromo domain-containing protein n=1 Tax=Amorphochlora amoebiformis TaxID=1561963 RepID=A0A7S0DN66_9EUKA